VCSSTVHLCRGARRATGFSENGSNRRTGLKKTTAKVRSDPTISPKVRRNFEEMLAAAEAQDAKRWARAAVESDRRTCHIWTSCGHGPPLPGMPPRRPAAAPRRRGLSAIEFEDLHTEVYAWLAEDDARRDAFVEAEHRLSNAYLLVRTPRRGP